LGISKECVAVSLPDVVYVKLLLNLSILGLVVWVGLRTLGKSIGEISTVIALLSVGALFVIAGVGYLWASDEASLRNYLLLLEIGVSGQLIDMGYSLVVMGLFGLGSNALRRCNRR
jgi:hypothetical protein